MSALHDRAPFFCILHFAFCIALASCASLPKPITLPSDPGTPFADFAAVHSQLSSACTAVRTLTMEIGLSGRAGDEPLRGRVIAGFERPSSMHLLGVAPFGAPGFILAARNGRGSLLLPRESRILRDATPEAILGALTGVALDPADLQAVFTGCVVPAPRATGGRLHGNGLASIDVESAEQGSPRRTATLYLNRNGSQWQLRAAKRDSWQLEYTPGTGSLPQSVRLISTNPDIRVGLTASLSQVEINQAIDPKAFAVEEPKNVTPLTLEELRQAGPLRGK
jgi:hypothetical protein